MSNKSPVEVIAEVLRAHVYPATSSLIQSGETLGYRCRCGELISVAAKDPGHHAHLAAEVVKALGGLTLESCHYSAFDTVAVRGGQTSTYIGERSACRWVSDWTPEVAP